MFAGHVDGTMQPGGSYTVRSPFGNTYQSPVVENELPGHLIVPEQTRLGAPL